MKKALKIMGKILLVILILVIAFVLVVFTYDRVKKSKEHKLLKNAGYENLVSVGNYSLNVKISGSENPQHNIVCIAGMDVADFSVSLSKVTSELSKENKVIFIDRAGYGLSDDTFKNQDIDRIVNDYRNALQNANIPAPYVLICHSLGGVYTTYWECTYPDEIEAVIYLDPTNILSLDEFSDDVWVAGADEFISAIGCKLGFYRLANYFIPKKPWGGIDKENVPYSAALSNITGYSFAMYSEAKNTVANVTKAHQSIVKTEIPKLFIDASPKNADDLVERYEYVKYLYESVGAEAPPFVIEIISNHEKAEEIFNDYDFKSDIDLGASYAKALGNCKYENVPGYHYIFMQKPEKVTNLCTRFLNSLDEN